MLKQLLLLASTANTSLIFYFTSARCFSRAFTPNNFFKRVSIQRQQPLDRKDSSSSICYAELSTSKRIKNSNNTTTGDELASEESRVSSAGGFARFTGASWQADEEKTISNFLDYSLRVILSDVGIIFLGSFGLLVCVVNHILASSSSSADNIADMGQQSRTDLLATFSSIALLLNGVSKLDVTSALAETVVLEGDREETVQYTDVGRQWLRSSSSSNISSENEQSTTEKRVQWALESILYSSPAETAVLMVHDTSSWRPGLFTGVVPNAIRQFLNCNPMMIQKSTSTPILDRFLTVGPTKESYLPTLQSLPGKVEFLPYLPANTQAVLILPVTACSTSNGNDTRNTAEPAAVLVLGSATAKVFTPRDIAWCQLIASRLNKFREDTSRSSNIRLIQ